MRTLEIKKIIKQITGFDYIAVRKGTGSMRGNVMVFSSFNDSCSFKPFLDEIKKHFTVEIASYYTLTLKI